MRDSKAKSVQVGMVGRRLITAQELAEKLHCDVRTVFRRADSGEIPPGVRIGGLRRWDLQSIDAWIARGCPRAVQSGEG